MKAEEFLELLKKSGEETGIKLKKDIDRIVEERAQARFGELLRIHAEKLEKAESGELDESPYDDSANEAGFEIGRRMGKFNNSQQKKS